MPGPLKRSPPRHVAVHEAGHAVAGWALNKQHGWAHPPFEWIAIEDGKAATSRRGCVSRVLLHNVQGGRLVNTRFPQVRDKQSVITYCEHDFICIAAGPLAQAKYQRKSLLWALVSSGYADADAGSLLLDYGYFPLTGLSTAQHLVRRARKLVNSHWPAINALADALLAQRRLETDKAVAIIEAAA